MIIHHDNNHKYSVGANWHLVKGKHLRIDWYSTRPNAEEAASPATAEVKGPNLHSVWPGASSVAAPMSGPGEWWRFCTQRVQRPSGILALRLCFGCSNGKGPVSR